MMKIYLDTCCLCRPYDLDTSPDVAIEAKTIGLIKDRIVEGRYGLVSSFMLRYEVGMNKNGLTRAEILDFLEANAIDYIGAERAADVKELSLPLLKIGIKPKDAFHLVCAVIGGCDRFITVDRRLLKSAKGIDMITTDPLSFIKDKEVS